MEIIQWHDSYAIGHDEIDKQHRTLVDMIAALQRSLSQGLVNPQVGKTLRELVQYTRTHFQTEQDVMRQSGYPGYVEHLKMHDHLIDQIVKILRDLKGGESITAIRLIEILKSWLAYHILHEDKKIGAYLREHAKSAAGAVTQ